MELRPNRAIREQFPIVLRQFTRLYLQRSPDDTTLIRWANASAPQTVASLNDRAVELARSLRSPAGGSFRIDGTVVETKIRHPTDDTLISDGVRVIGGRLLRSKELREGERALSEQKGELLEKPHPLRQEIGPQDLQDGASSQRKARKAGFRAAYERLLESEKPTLRQAGGVRELLGRVRPPPRVSDEISVSPSY